MPFFIPYILADVDRDGLISREDLYEVMDLITDTQMKDDTKKRLVDEVMAPENWTCTMLSSLNMNTT